MNDSFHSAAFAVDSGDAIDASRLYVGLPFPGNTDNAFDLEDNACVLR